MATTSDGPPPLRELIERHQAVISSLVRNEGRGLLAFESLEDVVQGVNLRALGDAENFDYRGEEVFVGWIRTLARRHIADRHDYWSAMRRGASRLVRLTWGSGSDPLADSPVSATGPVTYADRKEMLQLAARALATLPARDRRLVRLASRDIPLARQAEALELSYEAVQRASLRAIERYKKAFRIVTSEGGRG